MTFLDICAHNEIMSRQNKHSKNQIYEPKRCWVGEIQKICYASKEEAEVAAKVTEYDHGAKNLGVYKCEYGDHWHLSSK